MWVGRSVHTQTVRNILLNEGSIIRTEQGSFYPGFLPLLLFPEGLQSSGVDESDRTLVFNSCFSTVD